MVFNANLQYFGYIVAFNFIGWGNRSSRRKTTDRKDLYSLVSVWRKISPNSRLMRKAVPASRRSARRVPSTASSWNRWWVVRHKWTRWNSLGCFPEWWERWPRSILSVFSSFLSPRGRCHSIFYTIRLHFRSPFHLLYYMVPFQKSIPSFILYGSISEIVFYSTRNVWYSL
jgi:hypothetical protein